MPGRALRGAGRPDLRFHDLRHTGGCANRLDGATLAELMARLGHSTAGAALRSQHAAQDRDKVIAVALSALAEGDSRTALCLESAAGAHWTLLPFG